MNASKTVQIQTQSIPAGWKNSGVTQNCCGKDDEQLATTTTTGSRSGKSLPDGPVTGKTAFSIGAHDSLSSIKSEQSFDFVFDCAISSNDFVDDDIDNDSIEIARNQRSTNRILKKRRATSENARKQLRELR